MMSLSNRILGLTLTELWLWFAFAKLHPDVWRLTFDAGLGAATALIWRRYVLKKARKGYAIACIAASAGVICYLVGTSVWAYRAVEQRSALDVAPLAAVWVIIYEWHSLIAVVVGAMIATVGSLRSRS